MDLTVLYKFYPLPDLNTVGSGESLSFQSDWVLSVEPAEGSEAVSANTIASLAFSGEKVSKTAFGNFSGMGLLLVEENDVQEGKIIENENGCEFETAFLRSQFPSLQAARSRGHIRQVVPLEGIHGPMDAVILAGKAAAEGSAAWIYLLDIRSLFGPQGQFSASGLTTKIPVLFTAPIATKSVSKETLPAYKLSPLSAEVPMDSPEPFLPENEVWGTLQAMGIEDAVQYTFGGALQNYSRQYFPALPVASALELLAYYPDEKQCDITRAAAYQLGRNLIAGDDTFKQALQSWMDEARQKKQNLGNQVWTPPPFSEALLQALNRLLALDKIPAQYLFSSKIEVTMGAVHNLGPRPKWFEYLLAGALESQRGANSDPDLFKPYPQLPEGFWGNAGHSGLMILSGAPWLLNQVQIGALHFDGNTETLQAGAYQTLALAENVLIYLFGPSFKTLEISVPGPLGYFIPNDQQGLMRQNPPGDAVEMAKKLFQARSQTLVLGEEKKEKFPGLINFIYSEVQQTAPQLLSSFFSSSSTSQEADTEAETQLGTNLESTAEPETKVENTQLPAKEPETEYQPSPEEVRQAEAESSGSFHLENTEDEEGSNGNSGLTNPQLESESDGEIKEDGTKENKEVEKVVDSQEELKKTPTMSLPWDETPNKENKAEPGNSGSSQVTSSSDSPAGQGQEEGTPKEYVLPFEKKNTAEVQPVTPVSPQVSPVVSPTPVSPAPTQLPPATYQVQVQNPNPVAQTAYRTPVYYLPTADNEKSVKRKILFFAILGLFLVASVIWGVSKLTHKEPDLLVTNFEGLRRVEILRLVKQTYLEVIPFTNKEGNEGKLQFLIEAPAYIHGQLDMSQMQYERISDSMIQVTMPPPELSDVRIDLAKIKEYTFKGKKLSFMLGGGGKKYKEAFNSIKETLSRTKQSVMANAVKNGILDDTRRKGRQYVQNSANAIGYGVDFVEVSDSNGWAGLSQKMELKSIKSLEDALGIGKTISKLSKGKKKDK